MERRRSAFVCAFQFAFVFKPGTEGTVRTYKRNSTVSEKNGVNFNGQSLVLRVGKVRRLG
jgi:hypothetical protein